MPLIKSKSDKAFKSNIKAEIAAGKPQKQAVAIAYSTKRAAKKARGGAVDPMNYDSDQDYYQAAGRLKDEDDDTVEEQPPRRAVMAEQKRKEKSAKKNSANWQASEMYRGTDKPEALKQFNRLSRRKESNNLLTRVKSLSKKDDVVSGAVAKALRSEWSKKIGGGKPAPFKTGGNVKSCW
jgi:hypothetical protein